MRRNVRRKRDGQKTKSVFGQLEPEEDYEKSSRPVAEDTVH